MRTSTGAEPIREAFEIDLIYLIEDRNDCLSSWVIRTPPVLAIRAR